MSESEGWALLGELVRRRRMRLGLDQGDLKSRGGPGPSTVGKIERAEARVPVRTRQAIERALGWRRGDADLILAAPTDTWWRDAAMREDFIATRVEGDVPDLAPVPDVAASARDLTDDELLTELTYRVRRYANERDENDDARSTATIPAVRATADPEVQARLDDLREQFVEDLERAVSRRGSTAETRAQQVRAIARDYIANADDILAAGGSAAERVTG